ncbi:MAG: hypothetical protein AVDCRST_MAG11-1307, partial [uncultured Gemmatimonadaceae bacterium]
TMDKTDIWSKLAAPLPTGVIAWRQDGKPMQRDGKHFARFVCYIEANTVRERLDSVVPGEWDLTLELLPPLPAVDGEAACSFKARLQILGVIREDVGTGRDYKSAATDAFKRAAVRFGVAHELYAYEQNWVQVDSDSKYAKPLEDPQTAYNRRHGGAAQPAARREVADAIGGAVADASPSAAAPVVAQGEDDLPDCPKCGGRMWDNRATKRNPKAPDYKCRDRSCDGVVWPPKGAAPRNAPAAVGTGRDGRSADAEVTLDSSPLGGLDDIPF